MGIMTRLYHRSGGLTENPHKYFFMDMGENIHIHYRDLRIELSVPEFLEFAEAFERCAPTVKSKISQGYKDGVLPNTNDVDSWTSISLDAPLKNPVKYNANRISIEENLDGYHLHFRNYKLLFDRKSFDNILQAMNDVVERRGHKRDLDEVLQLIEYNDLEYRVIEANRDTLPHTAIVEIKPQYLGKVKQMFKALGFSAASEGGRLLFHGDNMEVRVRVGDNSAQAVPASPYVLLADYLAAMKNEITHKEVNLLLLPVLNAYGMVRSGENPYINLDFRSFLLDRANQRVIFQNLPAPYSGDIDEDSMNFSRFTHSIGLFLAKPNRMLFSEAESRTLQDLFMKNMTEKVASHPCVSKIYLLGSSTRSNLGTYEVPLVHFDWAKLASDFDILVEIDEAYPVPKEWEKKFFTDFAGSYYYHLGDLPHPIESPYVKQYPHVKYFNHLIEAYLFFPSNCNKEVKDKYLAAIKAELIFDRDVTPAKKASSKGASKKKFPDDEWVEPTIELMRNGYGVKSPVVSKIDVPSHNYIYKVDDAHNSYVVKIFSGANFTPLKPGSQAEHIYYEDEILGRLENCGSPFIPTIKDLQGRSILDVGSRKAMVFRYIDGTQFNNSLTQIASSAESLANIHRCLPEDAIDTRDFDYKSFISLWINWLSVLRANPRFGECINDTAGFERIAKQVETWLKHEADWKSLGWIHGHGDVHPRNFLFRDDAALVFDFQAARLMPRLEDIADGMIEFGLNNDALVPERMECFLNHYEAIFPLTEVERSRLEEFLLAEAVAKILTTLEGDFSHGYKASPNRMQALLDYCLSHTRILPKAR